MDLPPTDYRLMRFWADDLPPSARLAEWRKLVSRKLVAAEIETLSNEPFQVDANLRVLTGFRFGIALLGPSVMRRTPAIAAADNQDYYLIASLEGAMTVTLPDTEYVLHEGSAAFFACTQEVSFSRNAVGRLLCARFERAPMLAQMPEIDSYVGRVIDRSSEALRLFTSYLKDLDHNQHLSSVELRRLIVSQIYELLGLVLSSSQESESPALAQDVSSERLKSIKKYILDNLDQRDLTIAQVATASRLSLRQVQRFFESENVTFSKYVLAKRLQRVHAMLTDVRQVHRSVSDIVMSNGFGDVSYFNRAFRAHYGASPSAVRQSVMQSQA